MSADPQQPTANSQQPLAPLHQWIDRGLTPGVAAVIARDGRVVGELYAGAADGDRPVGPDTLFCLASITKLFVACAAMGLVEAGLVALDEPLGPWLPELAAEDRAQLSLRRLLTHTSRIGLTPTLDQIYGQYARLRPVFPPGSQVRYSNINFGLLAQVTERIGGAPFGELFRARVLGPLKLDQTSLPPPPDAADRLARVADTENPGAEHELFNSAWWRGLGLPYGGAAGTARDVARFITACLAERGVAGFLSPTSLDLMTRVQTGELAGGIPGIYTFPRADWGLGFELRGDKRLHPFGELTSPETFGHLGASSTLAWGDPDNGLVCVVLCNRLLHADRDRILTAFCRLSNAVAALA
jgi:CubicO group peptidase (beta-lactamase class C family)